MHLAIYVDENPDSVTKCLPLKAHMLLLYLGIEPGLKHTEIIKELGEKEVEQGPQLGHVILKGGAYRQKIDRKPN